MEQFDPIHFGGWLRARRRSAFLTQTDLATTLGISQALVSRWEIGSLTPSLELIPVLARALGTTSLDVAAQMFRSKAAA